MTIHYSEQHKPVFSITETVGSKIIYYLDGDIAFITIPLTAEQQAEKRAAEAAYRQECLEQEDWLDD